MIENKLVEAMKEAGIECKAITIIPETPEMKRRNKELLKYIAGIEKVHKRASKCKLTFKDYSTNTYSPFPAPREEMVKDFYRSR